MNDSRRKYKHYFRSLTNGHYDFMINLNLFNTHACKSRARETYFKIFMGKLRRSFPPTGCTPCGVRMVYALNRRAAAA